MARKNNQKTIWLGIFEPAVQYYLKLDQPGASTQQQEIAIADLQVKLAQIENQRGELASKMREQVTLTVLDFDTMRREFQMSQKVAKREKLRMKLLEVDDRFGLYNSNSFLANLADLDR